jgi:hypothetical protein
MTAITEFESEISRLQQEASAVERAPKSFDEVWPAVEADLAEAESTFRRLGPQLSGFVSQLPEHVEERRRAMVGMAMVANRKALLDSERRASRRWPKPASRQPIGGDGSISSAPLSCGPQPAANWHYAKSRARESSSRGLCMPNWRSSNAARSSG